jgi:hypothetical protein
LLKVALNTINHHQPIIWSCIKSKVNVWGSQWYTITNVITSNRYF